MLVDMGLPEPNNRQFVAQYAAREVQPSYRTGITQRRPRSEGQSDKGQRVRVIGRQQRVYTNPEGGPNRVTVTKGTSRARSLRAKSLFKPRPPKSAAFDTAKRARATGVSISILSWGMTLWLIQFPLALVNIAALGGAGALGAITENALGEIIVAGVDAVFATFSKAAFYVLGYEVSFGLLDSVEVLVFASMMLVWLVGIVTLIAMGIQYEIARLHPLYGQGAALKISAVIFALFGYFVPIMNLFPWFIFWCLAVWRYPR